MLRQAKIGFFDEIVVLNRGQTHWYQQALLAAPPHQSVYEFFGDATSG
jgi:hypothetical protein